MVAIGVVAGVTKTDVIPVEAREILCKLVSSWGNVADPEALEVVPITWAATNRVFQIRWKVNDSQDGEDGEVTHREVLLRIYGGGLFFDREDEIRVFDAVSMHGLGPKLLANFASGRVEEFMHAKTLSANDLRDPKTSMLIATKLREFHDLDVPGPKNIVLWVRLKNWLGVAARVASPEEANEFCLDALEKEISSLENELSSEDQRIGFCHNDLQYGNIMMNEETKQVTLIDYEYAGYNPVAYDISNHFCEMAADYHTETPHILDYNKYPDLDERKRFVQTYLSSSGEKPINDVEVETLLQDIEKFVFASHLWNVLWSIISQHVNNIGLNYMGYARQRMQHYWLKKSKASG